MTGTLTLIGAGEMMGASTRLHRAAFDHLSAPPHPVFLDTTAGFETNLAGITEKAIAYYGHHLQAELRVARYPHAQRATPAETAAAVSEIRAANIIFAGPGSPTYFIAQMRGSPVWAAVVERFQAGAHLIFASAAAIVVGRFALPVYEIYKAGEDPHWVDGLDLLGDLGLAAAVVPHYDDTSGGRNYDSRYCYLGAARFDAMQATLPSAVTILGIDAYTACTVDPARECLTISGQGGLSVIGDRAEGRFEAGQTVPLAALRSSSRALVRTSSADEQFTGYESTDAPGATPSLEALSAHIQSLDRLSEREQVELIVKVRALSDQLSSQPSAQEDALVDLALELRTALRRIQRFDLADHVRETLTGLGFVIADTPAASSWERQ